MDTPLYMVINPLFVHCLKKTVAIKQYTVTIENLRRKILFLNVISECRQNDMFNKIVEIKKSLKHLDMSTS